MKDIKSFYIKTIFVLFGVCAVLGLWRAVDSYRADNSHKNNVVFDTNFGSFLAAQHAIYVNDFDAAAKMLDSLDSSSDKFDSVKQSKNMIDFLNGKIPEDVKSLRDSKDVSSRLIYDAYLVQQDDWKSLYNRHAKNDSVFMAPLRIFSAVHQGKKQEAIKYLNSLPTNSSWKSFVRGQIALLDNDLDTAIKEFADVHPEFMNINDYLYLMSFYKEHEMFEDMDILRNDFIAKPSGMFILDYEDIPNWSNYAGYKNNLAFSVIQNISHTQIMIFTDFSLMMLKFAALVSNDMNMDAVNYYLGQYYFYNNGDFERAFNSVSIKNPLYLFGQMKIAERNGNIKNIEAIARKNPLFVPAVKIIMANAIKNGNSRAALNVVNRALKQKGLSEDGRVLFLKYRANIYLLFNQPKRAQRDLDEIKELDGRLTSDYLLLQARAWAAQNKELDSAYDYAMTLVKRNTVDVIAWDILGVIVEKREGVHEALELLERIGDISNDTSSLFEHLGDMYRKTGDKKNAIKSYMRALELSDDGMVVVPFIEKKLRKLK
jgi:tetratricopeptide (TPR) repeat protein